MQQPLNFMRKQLKICAFEVRDDERGFFDEATTRYGVPITLHEEIPTLANAHLVQGCLGCTVLGQGTLNSELLKRWYELGVRYIATRTIGYDHIDLTCASELGMKVCNTNYGPGGVAEFTIMLILMCLRHYKQALWRGQVNDFSLAGLEGRELRNLTVGILGTGRIGREVLSILQGFGCRLIAYDPHPAPEVVKMAEYVSFDELLAQSDIISLHMALTEETYHLINKENIAKMRDGVTIINAARGALADMDAMIKGIESGKIGALGLDVVEGEEGITHVDHRVDILANRHMAYLRQFRNVVMTPHMAFYTDSAVRSMVECAVSGIVEMQKSGTCPTSLT